MKDIDLWAQTHNSFLAGSSGIHKLEVTLVSKEKRSFTLSSIPGRGMSKMWSFNFDNRSAQQKCVSIFDISSIALVAASTDGWKVDSTVTVLQDSKNRVYTGSIDRNFNMWVDRNGKRGSKRRELTLTGHN